MPLANPEDDQAASPAGKSEPGHLPPAAARILKQVFFKLVHVMISHGCACKDGSINYSPFFRER